MADLRYGDPSLWRTRIPLSGVHTPIVVIRESDLTIIELELELEILDTCVFEPPLEGLGTPY